MEQIDKILFSKVGNKVFTMILISISIVVILRIMFLGVAVFQNVYIKVYYNDTNLDVVEYVRVTKEAPYLESFEFESIPFLVQRFTDRATNEVEFKVIGHIYEDEMTYSYDYFIDKEYYIIEKGFYKGLHTYGIIMRILIVFKIIGYALLLAILYYMSVKYDKILIERAEKNK